jgi:hypothetical protein
MSISHPVIRFPSSLKFSTVQSALENLDEDKIHRPQNTWHPQWTRDCSRIPDDKLCQDYFFNATGIHRKRSTQQQEMVRVLFFIFQVEEVF